MGLDVFHLSEMLPTKRGHEFDVFLSYRIDVLYSFLATDPFASVFGNESFEDGFADFSTLSKVSEVISGKV